MPYGSHDCGSQRPLRFLRVAERCPILSRDDIRIDSSSLAGHSLTTLFPTRLLLPRSGFFRVVWHENGVVFGKHLSRRQLSKSDFPCALFLVMVEPTRENKQVSHTDSRFSKHLTYLLPSTTSKIYREHRTPSLFPQRSINEFQQFENVSRYPNIYYNISYTLADIRIFLIVSVAVALDGRPEYSWCFRNLAWIAR